MLNKDLKIDLNIFPNIKRVLNQINSLLDNQNEEEITTIDFILNPRNEEGLKKEKEYYKAIGLKTKIGPDCSMYFENSYCNGFPPTSYGYWTTCYLNELTDKSAIRLEYFLKNNIMEPFVFTSYTLPVEVIQGYIRKRKRQQKQYYLKVE